MPNWVTTRIRAPKHAIQAMLNKDGLVDFTVILPFQGPHNEWDDISCAAEEMAEIACGISVSDNPLIAVLQKASRATTNIKSLDDGDFAQFVGMLENYRACGHLHSMAFARDAWGTKWNALESSVDQDGEGASFDTAWSYPEGVLIELSKRFPEDVIHIKFADEDIGCNCGSFTLKGGHKVIEGVAPPWSAMNNEQKARWKDFAYTVKGWTPESEDE